MFEQLFRKSGSAVDEMFATVEHQELGSSSQTFDQKRKHVGGLYRKPECARHGGYDERSITDRTEVHETNFTVEDGAHLMSDRNRHGRLPYASGPDNRDELLLGKLRLDRRNCLRAADHALQTNGQPRIARRLQFGRMQRRRRDRDDEAVAAPRHVCDIPPAGVALSQGFSQSRDVYTKADLVGP